MNVYAELGSDIIPHQIQWLYRNDSVSLIRKWHFIQKIYNVFTAMTGFLELGSSIYSKTDVRVIQT